MTASQRFVVMTEVPGLTEPEIVANIYITSRSGVTMTQPAVSHIFNMTRRDF